MKQHCEDCKHHHTEPVKGSQCDYRFVHLDPDTKECSNYYPRDRADMRRYLMEAPAP